MSLHIDFDDYVLYWLRLLDSVFLFHWLYIFPRGEIVREQREYAILLRTVFVSLSIGLYIFFEPWLEWILAQFIFEIQNYLFIFLTDLRLRLCWTDITPFLIGPWLGRVLKIIMGELRTKLRSETGQGDDCLDRHFSVWC